MLLIVYTPRDYIAMQDTLGVSLVLLLVLLLLTWGVSAFFRPSERSQQEELARQERIKAQSRQRLASRR
jgi:Na+-transporting methylmalonyl-CoA/oxaloacetate decarboxylase gamma subunit